MEPLIALPHQTIINLLHYYSVDSSRSYWQIFILAEKYYQQMDICLLTS